MGKTERQAIVRLTPTLLALALAIGGCAPSGVQDSGRDGALQTAPVSPGGSSAPPVAVAVGPLVLSGERDSLVEGVRLANPEGDCLHIVASRDLVISDLSVGPCAGRAVFIHGSARVTIENSTFRDSQGGVYAVASSGIVVADSSFRSTGRNPIQFDKVVGGGNAIRANVIVNKNGNPDTEDSISVYESGGTASSPLLVERNVIHNGGSSRFGSGIVVGDNGGKHTVVRWNVLIDPGQVGIGVAGGTDVTILENLVYSASYEWTNVGIYVWSQYEGPCNSIEVRGNVVEFYNGAGLSNPYHDGANCGAIIGWSSNRVTTGLEERLDSLRRFMLGE